MRRKVEETVTARAKESERMACLATTLRLQAMKVFLSATSLAPEYGGPAISVLRLGKMLG